jgi:DNA-binding Lrp family transcriptional regulator
MRTFGRMVPIEQLQGTIEELLKAGPRSIDQLARATGWSKAAVKPRVEQLQLEGRTHRVRVQSENSPGVCYQWHFGPASGAVATAQAVLFQTPQDAEKRGIVPFQHSVRKWPAINRRDPLVIALFGPARAHQAPA